VDWEEIRKKYEPTALGSPDEPTFYRTLNSMLGELRQSHLFVTGPGDAISAGDKEGDDWGPVGGVGITVRSIEGRATITQVEPGSAAARAGVRTGWVVSHVGGQSLAITRGPVPRRPVEVRFQLRRVAQRRLNGPVGTQVTLGIIDHNETPQEVVLTRQPFPGQPVQFGNLGHQHPQLKTTQNGAVGIAAFNVFLVEPILPALKAAIEGFRKRGARALILDLRGNPGGLGAMAIPVAAQLCAEPVELGTFTFRTHSNTLRATPSLGVEPFTGAVFILTDEGTASTSEILAAGLQAAGRATIVGSETPGYALPSAVETLEGGAILQYVVADFRTAAGTQIEGRGVLPDRRVAETRAAFKSGRDPILETALEMARRQSVLLHTQKNRQP